MIWQAITTILTSEAGMINTKILGQPKELVLPDGLQLPDEVVGISDNLGVSVIHSPAVKDGIVLAWAAFAELKANSVWKLYCKL